MGRKGGGQKGFMKSVRRSKAEDAGNDENEESEAKNKQQKQAQQLVQQDGARIQKKGTEEDIQTGIKGPSEADAAQKAVKSYLQGEASTAQQEEDVGEETRAKMKDRHKREVHTLRKSSKGGTKKKKEEAAKQMEELLAKHAAELKELEAREGEEDDDVEADPEADVTGERQSQGEEKQMNGDGKIDGKRGPSRAQKRRARKAELEAEREARINEEKGMMAGQASAKDVEEQELEVKLGPAGFRMEEIKADGHCLYRAVEHQLASSNGNQAPKGFMELRKIAAGCIRNNMEDFIPFFVQEESENGGVEEQVEDYCREMESTAAWGGELELKALAKGLEQAIVVHSAGMADRVIGEEFSRNGREPLRLCFMKEAYSLGNHYNSVVALEERQE